MEVRQLLQANRMAWILDEDSEIEGLTSAMSKAVDAAIVEIVVDAFPMESKAKLLTVVR